jgi:predicted membrane protein
VHLRMPSIDRGVQSFLWTLVFFLILYFGMVAVDVGRATALLISLVSAFLIFLFVRTRGR